MKAIRYFLLVVFLILAELNICLSQWSTDPAENNILAWSLYVPVIIPDMQNGVIVAGQTHWAFPIIYVQRMTVDGNRLYPGNRGLQISDSPYEQWIVDEGSREPEFGMSDWQGGCYIGYQIARLAGYTSGPDPSEFYDVGLYIQKLDACGNRLFGPNGLALMPDEKDSTGYHQYMKHWCADGFGGLYAIFGRQAYNLEPERDGQYLVRISAQGEILWGPKRLLPSINGEFIPYLDSNLNLNLYYRDTSQNPDKFIKINPKNCEIVSENEIGIGAGGTGLPGIFDYCFSDSFSAIFVFQDSHGDTLRIQKLDENGNKLFGNEPVIITHSFDTNIGFDVESDHNGGAYVLYKEYINPVDTIHLAHYDYNGNKLWKKELYCKSYLNPYNESLSVVPDGNVFILTEEMKYLTKIHFDGEILWRTMVTSRDTIVYDFWYWGLKADSLGGCIVVWHEIAPQFSGFRAQRVDKNGNLGGPTAVLQHPEPVLLEAIEIKSIYPNPFNDSVTFQFSLSHSQQITLKIVDLLGKKVITLKSGRLNGGAYSINWQGTDRSGQLLPSGIYFLVLQAGSTRVSQKFLILR